MHIANTPNPIYNYFLGNGALLEHIVIIVIIPQMFNTFSKLDLKRLGLFLIQSQHSKENISDRRKWLSPHRFTFFDIPSFSGIGPFLLLSLPFSLLVDACAAADKRTAFVFSRSRFKIRFSPILTIIACLLFKLSEGAVMAGSELEADMRASSSW